ncbi:MAG: hypothetical protein AAF849_18815 [Bacteroidota bacterium]
MTVKRTTWFVLLIALFFAGDRIAAKMLEKTVVESQFRYSRLYRGEAASDILLIGNSRGLSFYQPYIEKVTGTSTFNLSYNGMTMNVASDLIADYLDCYQPKLLLIDVTMCDHKSKSFTLSFAPYQIHSPRISTSIKTTDRTTYYAQQFSHLFRYNNELFQRILYYYDQSDKTWLLDRKITSTMEKDVALEEYRIDLHYVEELKKSIELAEAKGVKVRLLINPYYVPFTDVLEGLEDFKTQIEIVTKHQVYDFSRAIADKDLFGDYQHLNQEGSEVYIDLLKEEGILD